MSVPITDLFKLVQKYTWLGQQCYNVLHFGRDGGTGDAADLLVAWYNDVLPVLFPILSTALDLVGTDVINLSDQTDFVFDTYTQAGSAAGDPLAKFDAHSLTKFSPTRDIRASGIRIPGATEDQYSGGEATVATSNLLTLLAAVLDGPIVGNGWPFKLVVYTPGNLKTGGLPVAEFVSAVVGGDLTTQNSRKR